MTEAEVEPGAVDPVATLTGFARALRRAGVAADRTRLSTAVQAAGILDPTRREHLYWATRLTLCSEPSDRPVFDAVFDQWFGPVRPPLPAPGPPAPRASAVRTLAVDAGGEVQPDDDPLAAAASDADALGTRDYAALDPAERAEVHRMIELLRPNQPERRAIRRRPGGRERVDTARTVRQILRDGGEVRLLHRRSRGRRPRRVVYLIDVSGSMSLYSDLLLRFGHSAARAAPLGTEVFTIGTRLTRVTRQMRLRDPDLALQAAGSAIPDWSGGTRLGEAVRAFLRLWGQRGLARQASIVIVSDGWERGDAALLGAQLERLHRLAHTVIWVNPHRGKDGFAPATAGMQAVLPHVDHLVAGHSYRSLAELARLLSERA